MNQEQKKKLIIVLGMHRSGTSAITRALQVIGVDLGENLMSAVSGENEKGFFEDLDFFTINVELLEKSGHRWHSLTPVLPEELAAPAIRHLKLKAVEILRQKLSATDCFGLKDPRTARLLPFWIEVFEHLKVEANYIITFRNPMSVVHSLTKRSGFDHEKGYYLWLDHMLSSLMQTIGRPRLIVDYDRLMQDPERELGRIARATGLAFDSDKPEFMEYKGSFLEDALRHARFKTEDLKLDKSVPPDVIELHEILSGLSADIIHPDHQEVTEAVKRLDRNFHKNYSALRYMRARDEKALILEDLLSERNEQIDNLNQAITERDERIENLNKSIADLEGHLDLLSNAVSGCDKKIDHLNNEISQRERLIAEIFGSTTWKLAAPIRFLAHQVKRLKI